MSRGQHVTDDVGFLRGVLGTIDKMQQLLNGDRAKATDVAELFAIAEVSDWLESEAAPVRRRLDRIVTQHHTRARRAAQVQA
jgi:hypothetical protein